MIAVVALALAGSWIGYFLFTPMPSLTFKVFPATVTLHIVAGAVLVVYAVYLAIARRLPGGTPLDIPVLAFLGAYALATYASIDWRASIEPVLLMGAAIGAFYALSDLPFLSARTLRSAFMLVLGALSVYALWDVGNQYADYLRLTDQVEGLDAGNIFPPTVPRVVDVSDHTECPRDGAGARAALLRAQRVSSRVDLGADRRFRGIVRCWMGDVPHALAGRVDRCGRRRRLHPGRGMDHGSRVQARSRWRARDLGDVRTAGVQPDSACRGGGRAGAGVLWGVGIRREFIDPAGVVVSLVAVGARGCVAGGPGHLPRQSAARHRAEHVRVSVPAVR